MQVGGLLKVVRIGSGSAPMAKLRWSPLCREVGVAIRLLRGTLGAEKIATEVRDQNFEGYMRRVALRMCGMCVSGC